MVSTERVLGFRLRGHSLHRRVRDPLAALAASCGIRTTPVGSAPAALAARVTGLPAGWLDDALAAGTLVEVLGPKLVPVVVPAADVAVFTVAALPLDPASLRVTLGDRVADGLPDLPAAVRRATDAARSALAGGPLTRGELSAAMTKALPASHSAACATCGSTHVHESLFRAAGVAGAFVVAPGGGRTTSLVAADVRAGEDARLELVRRFLRCHGPAGPAEFATWARTGVADARQRWADLGDEVAPEGVLAADVSRLRRAGLPSGVRLLPPNDPYLSGPDRSSRGPPPARRMSLWPALRGPGAVLVDGLIAGTWRARKKGTVLRVEVTPFGGSLPALAEEADVLAVHRGCDRAEVA